MRRVLRGGTKGKIGDRDPGNPSVRFLSAQKFFLENRYEEEERIFCIGQEKMGTNSVSIGPPVRVK
jgi:hypothetical protein